MSPTRALDLLERTAELVDIASVSRSEAEIADFVERSLRSLPHLEVLRLGDNVLGRTSSRNPLRLVLAGHLDTVPPNGNEKSRIDGDLCWGLGAADMKGGLAVMLHALETVADPAVDVTFIAYVCEEIDQRFSGLRQVESEASDWLDADAAILGEPTNSLVEAGCQGVLRVKVTVGGERAHTARPWMGVNAIHRLAPVLSAIDGFTPRRPVIDGCAYREALQAVSVEGGVAANVVPDRATLRVNHRFAPDLDSGGAFSRVRDLLATVTDESRGDSVTLEDSAEGAAPMLTHPLLARLVAATGEPPKAKLGWTDVAFFAARGVPACNFGPGDPTLAHSAGERVDRGDLERAADVLVTLMRGQ